MDLQSVTAEMPSCWLKFLPGCLRRTKREYHILFHFWWRLTCGCRSDTFNQSNCIRWGSVEMSSLFATLLKDIMSTKIRILFINHCSSISASKVKHWRSKSIWVSSTKAVVEQSRPPVISTLLPKVNWWAFMHQMTLRPSATTTVSVALITASLLLLQRWPWVKLLQLKIL